MSLRDRVKRVGRKVAQVQAKAFKFVAPAVQVAGTAFFGAAGGAAATALTALHGQRVGATAARAEGVRGRAARAEGRKLRAYALKTGVAITGAGLVAGVASGAGALAPGISSVTRLFGGGASSSPSEGAEGTSDAVSQFGGFSLDEALTSAGGGTPGTAGGSVGGFDLLDVFAKEDDVPRAGVDTAGTGPDVGGGDQPGAPPEGDAGAEGGPGGLVVVGVAVAVLAGLAILARRRRAA